MKGQWKSTTVGEICTLRNGPAYKKKDLLQKGKYRVLRVGNFFTNRGWYYSDLELDPNKYCDDGDLLYAWSASFGPRIWSGGKVIFHYHIWRVDLDESQVHKRFLYYWFNWDIARVKADSGAGTTMIHVSMKSMNARSISLPPIPEQKRIVAILDEAFEAIDKAIANTEKNIENGGILFQRILDTVLTQHMEQKNSTTLQDVLVEQPRNGWSPPAAHHSDTGTPVLTLSAVTGFKFKAHEVKFTSAQVDASRHYWVTNGDFLMTRSNTPKLVGHVAIAAGIQVPTIYPDIIIKMTPDPQSVMSEYLYFQLRSTYHRAELTDRARGANPTMKKLSKERLQPLPVWCPSLQTQKAAVDTLQEALESRHKLEVLYHRKLQKLSELKKSLLQKAFSGQLTSPPHEDIQEANV